MRPNADFVVPYEKVSGPGVPIACLLPDPFQSYSLVIKTTSHGYEFRAERHPSHATNTARQKKNE